MKNHLLCLLFVSTIGTAQVSKKKYGTDSNVPAKKTFIIKKAATVNFSEVKDDYAPKLMVKELPKQGSQKMENYNYPERAAQRS